MATILNILMVVLMFTLRSLCVARTSCEKSLENYFKNWPLFQAQSKLLLKQDSLSYEQLKDVYMPECDKKGKYATKQCFMNKYCWCSDSDGNLLDGTFQKGKAAELDCTKCKVGNNSYENGQNFYIPETCETCKCQNQQVICQKIFCSNKTTFNKKELQQLKRTILLVVYYQYEFRDRDYVIKEEDLAKVPLDAALEYRDERLKWKFYNLDFNKDDMLSQQHEFNHFMMEIRRFVTSKPVYDMIFSKIDKDDDKQISKLEWLEFFKFDDNDSNESGSTTVDDEESIGSSGDAESRPSRSLPEVMKEFVRKLREQQRMPWSHKYF